MSSKQIERVSKKEAQRRDKDQMLSRNWNIQKLSGDVLADIVLVWWETYPLGDVVCA